MLKISEPTLTASRGKADSALKKKAKKIVMKARMKKLHKKEYSKLRAMVPSVAKKDKVSKVTVIEEAIKYIDELHNALLERLQNTSQVNNQSQSVLQSVQNGPSQAEINQRMLHELVLRNLAPLHTLRQNPICEKSQKLPSYVKNTERGLPRFNS